MSARNATTMALVSCLIACEQPPPPPVAANGETSAAVTVSPENIAVVRSDRIESGPSISGSLQPEKVANVRAEVGGPIVQALADRGQRVRRGELIARIDDTALRDSHLSARSALGTANAAADVARRNLERAERLRAAGAIAEREVEDSRIALASAQSQVADAQARLALAEKQLGNTQVRAPFAGVVSERHASAGDVVQPGSPLYTIVDPSSMQLEASVPAADLAAVRIGAPVEFRVTGYPNRVFKGKITRIDPVADPATGQVRIFASVPNAGGDLVGGLYAEGRIGAESRTALVAPLSALDFASEPPAVLRVKQGVVERVTVETGLRDEQQERIELVSGVAEGDTLLTGAAMAITPGTPVRIPGSERAPRTGG